MRAKSPFAKSAARAPDRRQHSGGVPDDVAEDSFEPGLVQAWKIGIRTTIVARDNLHAPGKRHDAQKVLSHLAGIHIGEYAHEQRPLGPSSDALELPGQVADQCVTFAGGQRDERDDRARRVAGCRDEHDRPVAPHVVTRWKAEVGRPLEAITADVQSGEASEHARYGVISLA
jgi:hypothetical protein